MYRFVNFKGFADATLELRTPVTILIGRNGSGKSNAIEALELLSGLMRGVELSQVYEPGRGSGLVPVRGGLDQGIRGGENAFTLALEDAEDSLRYAVSYGHFEELPEGPDLQVRHLREELEHRGERLLQTMLFAGQHLEVFAFTDPVQVFTTGGVEGVAKLEPYTDGPTSHAVLSNFCSPSERPDYDSLKVAADRALEVAGPVTSVQPNPDAMRLFVGASRDPLARDAANVAAVLLQWEKGPPGLRKCVEALAKFLAALGEDGVAAIELIEHGPSQQVTFGLRFASGQVHRAAVLSSGTLRAVALGVALLSAKQDSVVVVDCVDQDIHPARVGALVGFAEECATAGRFKVLFTTHNEALLNSLSVEQMQGVVLCWWDPESKASQMKHLTDLPDPWPALQPGLLGDFATMEWHRAQVVPGYAERRKVAMKRRMDQMHANLKAAEGGK